MIIEWTNDEKPVVKNQVMMPGRRLDDFFTPEW